MDAGEEWQALLRGIRDGTSEQGSRLAERVGFEPTVVLATLVFKTSPFSRSGTSPEGHCSTCGVAR